MNRRRSLITRLRQVLPDFVCREHKNGRQNARERAGDPVKHCLRRTPRHVSRSECVETIFYDVEVARRKSDRAEIVKRVKDRMKLVSLIRGTHARRHLVQFSERPTINLQHLVFSDTISYGIESMKIAERKPRSVAKFPVAVRDALQNLRRYAHVFVIISRGAPQA